MHKNFFICSILVHDPLAEFTNKDRSCSKILTWEGEMIVGKIGVESQQFAAVLLVREVEDDVRAFMLDVVRCHNPQYL